MKKNSLRSVILMGCCIAASSIGFSQTQYRFSGKVVDSSQTPLPHANIMVHNPADSLAQAFALTDKSGRFSVAWRGALPALLSASALGYAKTYRVVNDTLANNELTFVLYKEIKVLEEVIVTTIPKISVNGDTTTYHLGSFLLGNERNLEAALARLPGFQVDANGRISINGRGIQKILLEGDDLVNNNYTVVSKNLTPGIVNQVQVLDKYLEDQMMKGIEKTDDVAINLTFKNEFKQVFLGSVLAEGGSGKYYNTALTGMMIARPLKFYAMAGGNNIGQGPSFISNKVINPRSTLAQPFSPFKDSRAFADIANQTMPLAESNRNNFNNTKSGSLNLLQKLSKNLNLKLNLNATTDKNRFFSEKSTSYFLQNDTLFNQEANSWSASPTRIEGILEMQYNFSKKSRIKYNFKGETAQDRELSKLYLNNNKITQALSTRGFTQINEINYTYRNSETTALIVDMAQFVVRKPQELTVAGVDYSDVFNKPGLLDFVQTSNNPIRYIGGLAKYYTGYKKATVIFNAGYDRYRQDVTSGIQGISPAAFNQLETVREKQYARVDFNKRFTRYYELTARIGVSHTQAHFYWQNEGTKKEKERWRMTPNIISKFYIRSKNIFTVSYRFNADFPDAEQLYDSLIFSDYRNASRYPYNNLDQRQHNISMGYRFSNSYKQFSAFVNGSYGFSLNSYATSSLISKQFSLVERYPVPAGSRMLTLFAGSDKFIPSLSGTLRFSANAINSRYTNKINNNLERAVNSWFGGGKLAFNSAFDGFFNFRAFATFNGSINEASIGTLKTTTRQYSWQYYLQTDYQLAKNYFLQVVGSRYNWAANGSRQKPLYLLDASFLGHIIKDKLTVSASLHNAFNQKTLNFYNVGDYYSTLSTYSLLPRIFVAGIKYQIK